MIIKNKFKEKKTLNESENFEVQKKTPLAEQSQINQDKLQTVLTTKSKQFVFDCGAIMGSIKFDTGNLFSLKYHADKSLNVEDFISSVKSMIEAAGQSLTKNDINRLKNAYESR